MRNEKHRNSAQNHYPSDTYISRKFDWDAESAYKRQDYLVQWFYTDLTGSDTAIESMQTRQCFVLKQEGDKPMFQVNDYVVYEKYGVCQVADICNPPIPGADKNQKYYVLHPVNPPNQTIYTPVDNKKVSMRKTLTREEVTKLINQIPSIETIWTANEKFREDGYKKAIRTYDTVEWIRIIKTLYLRREERKAEGKPITATDERYLKTAETYLYSEFALALDIPADQVEDYISDKVRHLELMQMLDYESSSTEKL